eukprot:CAMPEP_0201503810 /NCGR_PEP_ID=MMETSP0151_2-20130828/84868_1 /ASSEMBLY_ACC=CAM_ASM_000257 /TAXON_ID=200890 /ORGANISM="Paramoeba atlantica, Strain 621/1 / CCAP 1560/9" /LENGTH=474 /DNA_ID=CAMNT_0047897503 /DNA_START=436 /DNA_END=1857 /DNA_ORIENTATION=-
MLIMYENQLEKLPPEIGQLESLTSLNVSQNQLRELPRELSMLEDLVELFAAANFITEIPNELGGGKNGLATLDLTQNEISSLSPDLFQNLGGVEEMYLGMNKLKEIGPELRQASRLVKLELEHNLLSQFPESIFDLVQLRELTLNDNAIGSFPPEFDQFEISLDFVDISNNEAKKKTQEDLSPLEMEALLSMMREGGIFIQHPDKVVQTISLTLKLDKIQLTRFDSKKQKVISIAMSKIERVFPGQFTKVLQKSGHPHRGDYYFSLLTHKGSTYDFEANTREERDDWVLAFEILIGRIAQREEMKAAALGKDIKKKRKPSLPISPAGPRAGGILQRNDSSSSSSSSILIIPPSSPRQSRKEGPLLSPRASRKTVYGAGSLPNVAGGSRGEIVSPRASRKSSMPLKNFFGKKKEKEDPLELSEPTLPVSPRASPRMTRIDGSSKGGERGGSRISPKRERERESGPSPSGGSRIRE